MKNNNVDIQFNYIVLVSVSSILFCNFAVAMEKFSMNSSDEKHSVYLEYQRQKYEFIKQKKKIELLKKAEERQEERERDKAMAIIVGCACMLSLPITCYMEEKCGNNVLQALFSIHDSVSNFLYEYPEIAAAITIPIIGVQLYYWKYLCKMENNKEYELII